MPDVRCHARPLPAVTRTDIYQTGHDQCSALVDPAEFDTPRLRVLLLNDAALRLVCLKGLHVLSC